LSDAGVLATVVESSASSGANSGAFGLFAPPSAAGANYRYRSRGTATSDAESPANFAAPITNVVTGISDIAADISTLRVNGTQEATSATDQGTGNYLTYPLYIGRRGGASNPLTGQIFSLIVRFGTNLSAATITQTETWIGARVAPTVVIT
jgi:hypothetical protein